MYVYIFTEIIPHDLLSQKESFFVSNFLSKTLKEGIDLSTFFTHILGFPIKTENIVFVSENKSEDFLMLKESVVCQKGVNPVT